MQLGDKKLIVQRASVGAKNSAVGQTAPVQIQVRNCKCMYMCSLTLHLNSGTWTFTCWHLWSSDRGIVSAKHGNTR